MDIFLGQGLLVQVNQCIYVANAFLSTAPMFPVDPTQIALLEATTCPIALGVSNAEYASLFKDKVAIWLRGTAPDTSCDPTYENPESWYYPLVEAGALGVVQINSKVGQDDYVFYQSEDRRWANINITIPVALCANTGTLSGTPASQSRLSEFLEAWHLSDPSERLSPFNETLTLGNVIFTDNLWIILFNSTLYIFAFRVVIPAMFFHVTFLSLLFAKERFAKVYRRSRNSFRSTLKTSLTPPFMALIVEACSTFFLGLFYVIDGMWVVPGNVFAGLRNLFMGELLLISMSTSVLVALNFADFRRAHKNMAKMSEKSFIDRHRHFLMLVAGFFLIFGAVASILRNSTLMYQLANMVAILCGFLISGWFFFEARSFSRTLKKMATTEAAATGTNLGQSLVYKKMVRRILKWTYTASFCLVTSLVLALVANFHTYFLWNTTNWPIIWFVLHALRSMFSLSKVLLCRQPNSERKKRKLKVGPDGQIDGSVASDTARTVSDDVEPFGK